LPAQAIPSLLKSGQGLAIFVHKADDYTMACASQDFAEDAKILQMKRLAPVAGEKDGIIAPDDPFRTDAV